MEFVFQFFELISNMLSEISEFLKLLAGLLSVIAAYLTGKRIKNNHKKALKKLLRFNEDLPCKVILPSRKGYSPEYTAEQREKLAQDGQSATLYDFIAYEETQIIPYIQRMTDAIGYEDVSQISIPDDPDQELDRKNLILCGGPLSNSLVTDIFSSKATGIFSFKTDFLFGKNGRKYIIQKDMYFKDVLIECEEDSSCVLFYGDKNKPDQMKKLVYHNGYAILIRKSGVSFSDNTHGTVLIAFGNGERQTLNAIRCLTERTECLYKRLKHRKDQFFVIVRCNSTGMLDFEGDSFLDLTDVMFGENTVNEVTP